MSEERVLRSGLVKKRGEQGLMVLALCALTAGCGVGSLENQQSSQVDPAVVTGAYANAIMGTSGLVRYWRLGESSGTTAVDEKGAGNGTYSGGYTLAQAGALSGDSNPSVSLGGATGTVSVGNPALTSSFSLEAWVYRTGQGTTGATNYSTIMGFDSTHRLLWQEGGHLLLVQFDGGFNSTADVSDNAWHHIVYVFNKTISTEFFYVDGVASGSHATTLPVWNQAFKIGAYDMANYMFKGRIDEVAIYNVALTASQVLGHYNQGKDGTVPTAVTNLAVSSPTSITVVLTWTSPGDDGSVGTATSYDIRRSTSAITTDALFNAATVVGGTIPAPAAGGTVQNMTVTGLSASTTYYFAMKTKDEVPNTSSLSNAASGTTAGTGGTTYRDVIMGTSGLVRYWRLGESSGTTAVDEKGAGNGTYSGGYTLAQAGALSGDSNPSVSLGGATGTVSVGNPALTSSFSLEAWVYRTGQGTTGATNYSTIMGFDSTHRLLWQEGGHLLLVQFDGGFNSTADVSDNAWHHIVYVFNKTISTEFFYVDGVASGSHATTLPVWNQAFKIGAYDMANYMFKGRIDEVAIYNVALTATQIQSHFTTATTMTGGAPAAPMLSSPASGSTGIATNPTLSWAASSGATSYGIQVSTSSTFATTVVNASGISTTSYPVSGLSNSTLYYWRANATNASGTSAWSAAWTFTTTTSNQLHYYVSTTGNDSNNGSAGSPWATLDHAATGLTLGATGTTVHVASGTYAPGSAGVTTARSGTTTARIRYISDVRWGARIAPVGAYFAWTQQGDYVDVVGFEVVGDSATNLGIYATGSFGRVLGNHVRNIPVTVGCSNGNGGGGIDAGNYNATDVDIIGNVVHDVGPIVANGLPVSAYCNNAHGIYHATLRGRISNNISYRNADYGIHLWHSANNIIIENNVVFENGATTDLGNFVGGAIMVGASSPVTADNVTVANNIVYRNRGLSIREMGSTGSGNRYYNNIVFANGNNSLMLQTGTASGTVSADPLFVNYQANGSGDYHLGGSSPAINAGTQACAPVPGTGCAPTFDYDGGPRPVGAAIDIGAYESGASPAAWPWY